MCNFKLIKLLKKKCYNSFTRMAPIILRDTLSSTSPDNSSPKQTALW